MQSPKAEPGPVLFECLSSPMEAASEKKAWFKVESIIIDQSTSSLNSLVSCLPVLSSFVFVLSCPQIEYQHLRWSGEGRREKGREAEMENREEGGRGMKERERMEGRGRRKGRSERWGRGSEGGE